MKTRSFLVSLLALLLCFSCKEPPVENIEPTCTIVFPTQGAQFTYGVSLNVQVSAQDEDGNITKVLLYVDNREVGTRSEKPYDFHVPVSRLAVGTHIIKAIAYDDAGDVGQHNISIRINSVPEEVTKYAVGDYYQEGATRGIIYQVNADSTHGMMLSMVESQAVWADSSAATLRTMANHANSGSYNHNTLSVNYGLTAFPAVSWAANLNDGNTSGWFLPAKNELLDVLEVKELLQNALLQHNAPSISESAYWTSTESESDKTWAVDFSAGEAVEILKTDTLRVRAVRAF